MELGTAASIIAVLQLSEAVLSSCYCYAGKVKESARDIDRVIHETGYLSTLLRDLQATTENTACPPNTLRNLTADSEHSPLTICAQCLKELKVKLPGGPVGLRQKLQ